MPNSALGFGSKDADACARGFCRGTVPLWTEAAFVPGSAGTAFAWDTEVIVV